MADKFKKIDKEFQLTDSSVNCYGFRLLTTGYLMAEFQKNPIGYYMHQRDNGVLLKWDDVRKEGDKIVGKPVINLSHPRGEQTVDEVENGFLNAASVGHIVVLELSDDPALKLEGQTGPTATKWFNRECSLVDVPGNFNSLALYDADGNAINLADFTKQNNVQMKQIILTASQLAVLNLKADADAAAVDTALSDLVAKANKVPQLESDLAAANTAKKTAEDALTALQKKTNDDAIDALLAAAVKEGRITVELSAKFKTQFTKAEGLKDVLAAMPVYKPLTQQLQDNALTGDVKLSWSELDKQGKLESLKANNIELFKQKYKEQFGIEYKG